MLDGKTLAAEPERPPAEGSHEQPEPGSSDDVEREMRAGVHTCEGHGDDDHSRDDLPLPRKGGRQHGSKRERDRRVTGHVAEAVRVLAEMDIGKQ